MRPYLHVLIITLIVTISFGQEVEIVSNGEDRSFRINLPDDTENSVPPNPVLTGPVRRIASNAIAVSYTHLRAHET